MPVSEIQGELEVTVVSCGDLKYTKWFSRHKPYAVFTYGNTTYTTSAYKDGGKYPVFGETFVIKTIERNRQMSVKVCNSNIIFSDHFIGAGWVKLDKVLSQGSDDSAFPLFTLNISYVGRIHLKMKYSGANVTEISAKLPIGIYSERFIRALKLPVKLPVKDAGRKVCNASSEIIGSPSNVGEQEKMGESSHLNMRRETNLDVMKKVKDVKNLKEKGITNSESIGTFINDLEKATPKRFSHEELKKVTSDFATTVGSGGFGVVYKGQFLDGTEVAVKVLAENNFVQRTFEAEVLAMFKTSHRNLVKFYGYCFDDNMKALVFEYMKNGSLDEVLYKNHLCLEWERLYKISIEIAQGLSYLHDGCNDQIIHHDVKASNVLLDSDLSPKITDFGLARLMSRSVSHFTWTGVRGTNGYIAPEMCIPFSEITHKCDVCSFGMMMFEVFGMRRHGEGSEWFPKQVWLKFDNGELDEIIDDCGIHTRKDRANAKILSMVALWCAQFTPQARPNMSTVVKMLEGEIPVTEPPNPFLPAPEVFYSQVSSSLSTDRSMNDKTHQKNGAGSICAEIV